MVSAMEIPDALPRTAVGELSKKEFYDEEARTQPKMERPERLKNRIPITTDIPPAWPSGMPALACGPNRNLRHFKRRFD